MRQFSGCVNVSQVLTYGPWVDAEKLGDLLLVEPERLGFIEHLDPDRSLRGLVQDEFAFVGSFCVGHALLQHAFS